MCVHETPNFLRGCLEKIRETPSSPRFCEISIKKIHTPQIMYFSIHSLFVVLALSLPSMVRSHSHPSLREDCSCVAGEHEFESYHIHVLFYPDGISQFENNTHSSKYARALRKKFVDHFWCSGV